MCLQQDEKRFKHMYIPEKYILFCKLTITLNSGYIYLSIHDK